MLHAKTAQKRGLFESIIIVYNRHSKVPTETFATPGLHSFLGVGWLNVKALLPAYMIWRCHVDSSRQLQGQHIPPFDQFQKHDQVHLVITMFKALFGKHYAMTDGAAEDRFKKAHPGWWPEGAKWDCFSKASQHTLQALFKVMCLRCNETEWDTLLTAVCRAFSAPMVPVLKGLLQQERAARQPVQASSAAGPAPLDTAPAHHDRNAEPASSSRALSQLGASGAVREALDEQSGGADENQPPARASGSRHTHTQPSEAGGKNLHRLACSASIEACRGYMH